MKIFRNLFFASIIFLIIFTTSCNKKKNDNKPHSHEWIEATCTKPKTCKICNAVEGSELDHDLVDGTCTSPISCSRCNETFGNPYGHSFKQATCTKPKTCSICGKTEGDIAEHSWKDATYDAPKTCSVCGKTEGDKLSINLSASLSKDYLSIGSRTNLSVSGYSFEELNVSFSEKDIISIDEYGKITALNIGTTQIILTHKTNTKITTTLTIDVISKMPDAYTSFTRMTKGDKTNIFIKNFGDLQETSLNDFNIILSSDAILKLNDDNSLEAIGYGTETIKLVSKRDERITTTISIDVINSNSFVLLYAKDETGVVKAGEQFTISLNEEFQNKGLIWFTSNSNIAVIDDYGRVSVKNEGFVTITVYNPNDPANKITKVNYNLTVEGEIEVDYISRLIHTALKENGTKEEGTNKQKYGEWFGNNGEPWCATFVTWCWYHSGLSYDLLVRYQGCTAGMKWCTEQGIMHYVQDFDFGEELENGIPGKQYGGTYKPVAGDIVFFLSAGMGHTGIVIYSDDTYLYTIEGNTSDKVAIKRWTLTDARITGYAHPKYPEYSGEREDFSWIKEEQEDGTYLWTNVSAQQKVD